MDIPHPNQQVFEERDIPQPNQHSLVLRDIN